MKPAVARIDLASEGGAPERASGVIEVYLKDGRQFSLLAATPAWFGAEAARLGLRFYYGAPLVFLPSLTPERARRAAKAMLAEDEQLLVRYDAPRRTPSEALAAFAAAHPRA